MPLKLGGIFLPIRPFQGLKLYIMNSNNFISNLRYDIPSSIVVFLVAMPLCLGIALASGAPLYSGIIAGIVGGLVVGSLSGSALGVSGPAAGLAVIVLNAILDLGSFEVFLVAVVLAGILQLIMGYAKAGIIAYYFPSSVIHGMLAGIGVLILLKQIPHAFGYDKDPEGDFEFFQADGENTISELVNMLDYISPGVIVITLISIFILVLWESKFIKGSKILSMIPGPLLVVITGVILNKIFSNIPELIISEEHLVVLPVAANIDEFLGNFSFPEFSALSNYQVYTTAVVLAVVGSLETLLSVEATDKQDPMKRITPTNRELKAQGVGNIISGLIGGLPLTQVIVRSSANQQSGAKSKTSAIAHGLLLLLSVVLIPKLLNLIPLATLAAILLMVGFKLARPSLFKKMYREGRGQLIPFTVTIVGIIFTNLLIGIALGMVVAVFIILRNNYRIPFKMKRENLAGKENIRIALSEDVSFLNKASLQQLLLQIPNDSSVEIDARKTHFIHHDAKEIIEDFEISAKLRNINVSIIDLYSGKQEEPLQHFELLKNGK